MNLIDLLDPNHDGAQARDARDAREGHYGLDEQDEEVIAAMLYTCPDESDHEHGSPLNFTSDHPRDARERCFNRLERAADIDIQIRKAFQDGDAARAEAKHHLETFNAK